MMEQNTQTIHNHERVKKKVGRPKGPGPFTDEENKERARQRSMLDYSLNIEKERERKRLEYQENIIQKEIYILFPHFHLNKWQPNYIIGELQIYIRSPLPKVIEYRL